MGGEEERRMPAVEWLSRRTGTLREIFREIRVETQIFDLGVYATMENGKCTRIGINTMAQIKVP